ncbi:MAG TPA: S-methyl-5'-thioadenosine phosphorylase [Noviherbaspirillum sp.]|uniref:S-methyl-5'-thioadenosine phosphorylase n=1 Tax=Noviherbaspirillum sp. TaxID=1926288 RepID=UPI002D5CE1CC|nr:S-methyl-5'-thioadenosine phosphorylase [Noviherbaspirillum sp.]HYD96579.1 S-methyl-5'-thioadenosine phosphorylase [Noviherbaspirillum sp.]
MLAIIGGTGVYQMDGMEVLETLRVDTPFGEPSSAVVRGAISGREMLFLARHGTGHQHLPHEINYRANVFALKSLGATQIIGISAVGSLREEIAPGDLAVPTQYFDWTRGRRPSTFFGEGIAAHISAAKPVSNNMVEWIAGHARKLDIRLHAGMTYACVEGPRLGTRAESHFLRMAGCDLVGMTNIPEVFLAREAQICYATIGIATDYDCWMEDPSMHVTANSIFALYRQSLQKAQSLLLALFAGNLPPEEPEIRGALAHALLTPEHVLSDRQRSWLKVLQR